MENKLTIVGIILAIGAGVPPAAADCVPVTAEPEYDSDRDTPGLVATLAPLGVANDDARYYVENDVCQLQGCAASTWVYEETNDRPGLQRKDAHVGDQTCGLYPADKILV